MKIVFKDTFINRLESQIDFISIDSANRARKFKSDLFKKTKQVPANPYQYRRSIYFGKESTD